MRQVTTVAVMREGETGYTHADTLFWVSEQPALRADALVTFEHPVHGDYVSDAIGYHHSGSYAANWIEVVRDSSGYYAVTIPDWSRDHEFRRVEYAMCEVVPVAAVRDETTEPAVEWVREE